MRQAIGCPNANSVESHHYSELRFGICQLDSFLRHLRQLLVRHIGTIVNLSLRRRVAVGWLENVAAGIRLSASPSYQGSSLGG